MSSRMDGLRDWVQKMDIDQSTKTLCLEYVDGLEALTDSKPNDPETRFQVLHGRLMLGLVSRESITADAVHQMLEQHKESCVGAVLLSGGSATGTKKATMLAAAKAFGAPGAWIVTVIAFAEPLNKLLMAVVEGLTGGGR